MKSKVFFSDLRAKANNTLLDKVARLFEAAREDLTFTTRRPVAVKLHWGEEGNIAFLPPLYLRTIVDQVRAIGGRPFLTDTNTLYRGTRHDAIDNTTTALRHGFGFEGVGAPIVIADGLVGENWKSVPGTGKHFESLRIAGAIHRAEGLVVVSHVKGHLLFGFGGAIKNLGMGCSDPAGKQQMHADVKPRVKAKRCTGCETCVSVCPVGAAALLPAETPETSPVARIDLSLCIGCAQCIAACPVEAIPIQWGRAVEQVQEKTAEYALAVFTPKREKALFFNFLVNITPDCDCMGYNDTAIVADLGILASRDPVAIDQASMDLIGEARPLPGTQLPEGVEGDKFEAIHGHSWTPILAYGEEIGLGSRSYELLRVE